MAHFSFYWLNHYPDLADDIGEEYLTDDIDKEWMREKGLRLGGFEEIKNEGRKRPFWVDPKGIVYYYEDLKRLKKKKSDDDAPPRDNDWQRYVKDVANPMPVLNSYNFVTDSKATKNRYSPNQQTAIIDELYVKDALPSPKPQKRVQEPLVPSVGTYNVTPVPPFDECEDALAAAYMADDVYRDHDVKLQDGWTRSSLALPFKKEDPKSGLFSDLYERKKKDGSIEYAYVFRGTEPLSFKDWKNDVQQLAAMSAQYEYAAYLANRINEFFIKTGKKITFIGHSLGGGLASLAARMTGSPAITFNAAGLSPFTVSKYSARKLATIRAFVVKQDIVDYAQRKVFIKASGDIIDLTDESPFNVIITYSEIMGHVQPLNPSVVWANRVAISSRGYKHTMGVVIAALKKRCK